MTRTSPRDIVIIGMTSSWDLKSGVMNRNAAVLYELLSRPTTGKVLLVNFLPFTLTLSLKTALYARTVTSRLQTITVSKDMHPRCAGKQFYALSIPFPRSAERAICRALKDLCMDQPLGISYHPLFARLFLDLPLRSHIFEAVDDWRHHPSFITRVQQLTSHYQILEQNCDGITTVSPSLRNIFSRNPHVAWIPNGVDLETFDQLRKDSGQSILSDISHPIIGYNGVIQGRIDLSFIEFLAQQHPDYSIVLIGPIWPRVLTRFRKKDPQLQRLKSYPNVHFLGFQTATRTMRAILDYDVAILPHHVTELTHSMNPMKLYEYLGAGKPVVSTPIAGREAFPDLIRAASTPEAFVKAVEDALAFDSKEREQQRIAAVANHTWRNRVDSILQVAKGL